MPPNYATRERLLDASRDGTIPMNWNVWRKNQPETVINLRGAGLAWLNLAEADLHDARLSGADFYYSNLFCADLRDARLAGATLTGASLFRARCDRAVFDGAHLTWVNMNNARFDGASFLKEANLSHAVMKGGVLRGARLRRAILADAVLVGVDLRDADLRGVNFDRAVICNLDLRGADLTGASLCGTTVRDIETDARTTQKNLEINYSIWPSRPGWLSYKTVTVDDIRTAQFADLVDEREAMGRLVEAGTLSVVLLLGRFSGERRRVLGALDSGLRRRGYNPCVFDFPRPSSRDVTETVRFIAGMARFIIVDLTAPKSTPLELQAVAPETMIPIVPIIEHGQRPFSMFADLQRKYSWVLDPVSYRSRAELIRHLDRGIIGRAERMASRLRTLKAARVTESVPISRFKR